MKRIVSIALLALAACGSPSEDSSKPAKLTRPPGDYFVWDDPGVAAGNVDADYEDCRIQIEKDPALGSSAPDLAIVNAYIKCMTPKGWKLVNPEAAAQAKP